MGEEFRIVFEEGKMEDMYSATCEHGDEEVGSDDKKSFFLLHIGDTFFEVRFIGNHIEAFALALIFFHMGFFVFDSRLEDGCDEKCHCVECKQRCSRPCGNIDEGSHWNHESGKRIKHTGNGVGFREVSFRYEIRVETFVGYTVDSINGPDQKHDSKKYRIVEPLSPEQ